LERSSIAYDANGEIIRFDKQEVNLKNKEREAFFVLFTKHISVLGNLTKRANEVLAILLQSKVTWSNEVLLDNVTRNEIADQLNTTLQTVKNAISNLVQNDILLLRKVKGGYKYALNPYLFGRGKWNEIENMKIQITKEFDFKNEFFRETIDTVTKYEGLPAPENIEVVETQKTKTKNGTKETAIIVDNSKKSQAKENIIDTEAIDKQKNISAIDKLKSLSMLDPLNDAALKAETPNEIRAAGEVDED
jgi:predicted transcriptional regulator